MLFESDNWIYNINHFPGKPGQGTRSMIQYEFIEPYAKELHPDEYGMIMKDNLEPNSNKTMNAVRELVLNDDDSFGSGFWLLAKKKTEFHNAKDKLRDGNLDDFKDYMKNGIGLESYEDIRTPVWNAVNNAIAK
ncbi:hypothetical protein GGI07_000937 [Coemansia sp. Benny D115]|nr:hypothetical protein GGI07_000937 [Coemansia sp. Benny D115]